MEIILLIFLFVAFVIFIVYKGGKRGLDVLDNEKHTKQYEKDVQEYLADKKKKEAKEEGGDYEP